VKEESPPKTGLDLEQRVRALGFDPSHLTPDEQAELVEIHTLLGEPALRV
jgi:hypothetical protein